MEIWLKKKLRNRGTPEEMMLELTTERWREAYGTDDAIHNTKIVMLTLWLDNSILLGFAEDHKWDTHLDKDTYVR